MTETAGFRDPRVLVPFLLITLIWGSTWIVIKDQLGEGAAIAVPHVWSVSYRFFIAGAAMMAIARLKGEGPGLARGGHALALVLGTFQFVVNYNFVYASERYITSGLAAVVFALLVAFNALLVWLFSGQRVSARFAAGSAVAMAGVALLFVQEMRQAGGSSSEVMTGLALVLFAVLAASLSNVMQIMPAVKAQPLTPMLGWAMLYGAAIDAVFAWAFVGPPVMDPRPGYWIGLLYLGVIASALAFWLYFEIIRKIGPAKAAYSSVLIPVIAMAFSTMFEGYRWSALAIAGGALTIAGLVIALRSGRPAPAPVLPPTD
jgi:drug/metabolite transporter (DMT)-like permease